MDRFDAALCTLVEPLLPAAHSTAREDLSTVGLFAVGHWREALAAIGWAWEQGRTALLIDAALSPERRQEIRSMVSAEGSNSGGPGLALLSGGSSGRDRIVWHTRESLYAAATGYCERFGGPGGFDRIVNVLPLFHVSGIMPLFRAAALGFRPDQIVFLENWRDLGERGSGPGRSCISLVPTQLQAFLQDASRHALLRAFSCIHIGGAALDVDLREGARRLGVRLAPGYGMTETAAMVCSQDPESFLEAEPGYGLAMPHAQLSTEGLDGRIVIVSGAVCRRVTPLSSRQPVGPRWLTDDAGEFDAAGRLLSVRRLDRAIVSGGEKVHPESVEQVLLEYPGVVETLVFGRPDPQWGQRVEAVVVTPVELRDEKLRAHAATKLRAFEVPKVIWQVREMPRTEAGKIDRGWLDRLGE